MRTVYLDQYTDEHAEDILEELERADIAYHVKTSGRFTRFLFAGEWGVRIFVDADRVEEARAIADRIIQED